MSVKELNFYSDDDSKADFTAALMREHKIIDVFYGDKWHNA